MGAGSAGRCRTLWSFQTRANLTAARPYRLQHTRGRCHSSVIVHAPVTHGPAVARSVPTWELSTPTPASRLSARSTAPTAAAARESHDRACRSVHRHRGHRPAAAAAASPPRGGGRSRRWATRIPGRPSPSGWCRRARTRAPTPRATGATTWAPRACRRRSTTRPWHPDSRTSSSRARGDPQVLQLLPRHADARAARRSRPATGASSTRRRNRATTPRRSTPASARELTVGPKSAVHRYTFPRHRNARHRDRLLARRPGDPARRDDPAAGAPRVDRPGDRPGRDRRRGCAARRLHRVRRQGVAPDALVRPAAHARRHPARRSSTSVRRPCGRSA